MRTLVRLSMTVIAFSLLYATAKAQPGRGHGHGPGHGHRPDSCHMQMMVKEMAVELSLSREQEQKILELHDAHMKEVQALRQENKKHCTSSRETILASRKEMDDQILRLLNSDQAVKYNEFKKGRRGPHGACCHNK